MPIEKYDVLSKGETVRSLWWMLLFKLHKRSVQTGSIRKKELDSQKPDACFSNIWNYDHATFECEFQSVGMCVVLAFIVLVIFGHMFFL
jgi:hypothetical protein